MINYEPESISGVVEIAYDLYTKSPESLTALKKYLTGFGYNIEDSAVKREDTPREVQEKKGWYLWFASLSDDKWDKSPTPNTISLYEAWHWAPLIPSEDLYKKIIKAAGIVSRKDYYYQDGRPAFEQIQIDRILKFIDEFTTIDVNKVKPYIHKKISGPGMIDTLAKLTGHEGYIETASTIGNALAFFGDILEKRPVTQNELDEAVKGAGLDDPENALGKILGDDFVRDTFNAFEGNLPKRNKKRFNR